VENLAGVLWNVTENASDIALMTRNVQTNVKEVLAGAVADWAAVL
jgi:hypothetical protein